MLAKLKEKNEKYQDLEIEIIDEDLNPTEASAYQYKLVPNFWVGGEKALEGIPKLETVQAVLDQALNEDSAGQTQSDSSAAGTERKQMPQNERYETENTPAQTADPAEANTRLPEDLPEAPVVKDLTKDDLK